ncbi:MAG: multicopper oxidase domain-containing protein, partial [Gaiellaceae bacterium]
MIAYLEQYATTFELPIELDSAVRSLTAKEGRFFVGLEDGRIEADQVVVATGPFQVPHVPALAGRLAPEVFQTHSTGYRRPGDVPEGTVLVVGGGNTGFQIAGSTFRCWMPTAASATGEASPKFPACASSASHGSIREARRYSAGSKTTPSSSPRRSMPRRRSNLRAKAAPRRARTLARRERPARHKEPERCRSTSTTTPSRPPSSSRLRPRASPSPVRPEIIDPSDGEEVDLQIAPGAKRLGDATVRMLAYNGSIPGPTLQVREGSELVVNVTNEGDLEATVHWHGLRLDNRFDGTHETQAPIPVGGDFSYRIEFPDPGVYWYHPHIREDYGQEMGLYGNILVVPAASDYWPPVHREILLTLDDVLVEDGKIAPFSRAETTFAAMGRFGNVLLVGGDSGRYEREEFVESVVLAPSERAVVDVLFAEPGQRTLEHRTPERAYPLAAITVGAGRAAPPLDERFDVLRANPEWAAERERLEPYFDAPADKTLALVAEMDMGVPEGPVVYACPMHPEVVSTEPELPEDLVARASAGGGHAHDDHGHEHAGAQEHGDHAEAGGIEWEDDMVDVNRMTTPANMRWNLVDRATGSVNHEIDWEFRVG